MDFDVLVIGGTVVDGSGAPPFSGNVGIRDGKIVAVGAVLGSAKKVIDATGCIVTPGFVDLHCHYDGQVSWDETLSPSAQQGVTTCVIGNCGVGFAPVHPEHRQKLIELMEGVEDIPGAALAEGIRWGWESFPEYLDFIASMPRSIDVLAQVPHDAVRVFVMGERALAGAPANDEDIARMRAVVREALEAGAAGFSTGRTDNHRAVTGDPTPAAEAEVRELQGIVRAFDGLGHGVLQAVSDFDMDRGPASFDGEFDVLEAMATTVPDHPLSISLMQRDPAPEQWRRILARVDQAVHKGLNVRVQVAPRAVGVLLGFQATFQPFIGFPSYKAISHLPLDERVARMREPEFKARLLTEKSEPIAGDGSPIPPMADQLLARLDLLAMRLFRLGERPEYEPRLDQSLGMEARLSGRPVLEVLYDALLERDGRALLYFPLYNYITMNLDQVREMLTHPRSLIGLSDGGAHVGTVCDASYATFALQHWVRDRKEGRLPLELVVRKLTHDTASYIGLRDRGLLSPGLKADVNVIRLDELELLPPRIERDLPAGGHRLAQDARGYRATLVAGDLVVENDRLTSARPGKLVRLGRSS